MVETINCPGCGHEITTDKTAGRSGNQEVKCGECRESHALALWRLSPGDDPGALVGIAEVLQRPAAKTLEALPPLPIATEPMQFGWRCPYCGSDRGYDYRSKQTTAGIVFAVVLFLFLCLPLFWIGFFIREQVPYCRACRMDLK